MREVLLQDELATSALLRGSEAAVENGFLWITTAAQMGMGFILPFALVFVAIPLETFVHSLRTVLGLVGIGLLRALALVLRVLGNGFRHLGTLAERLYDLPLFVPLWLESQARCKRQGDAAAGAGPAGGDAMKRAVGSRVHRCSRPARNPHLSPGTRACICCSTRPAPTAASCARPRT